jgi:hypothetical protein
MGFNRGLTRGATLLVDTVSGGFGIDAVGSK